MDVRLGRGRVDALADDADRSSFDDRVTPRNVRGAELEQSDCVPVGRLDRDGAAARGDEAGEGDGAAHGRERGGPHLRADVDAAVLPARIGVGAE